MAGQSASSPRTWFAPPERAGEAQVRRQAEAVGRGAGEALEQLFDAVNEAVFVLNAHRQIVFCNRSAADLIGLLDRRAVYGLRPGEAIGCVRGCDMPDGCGTSRFCRTCGAVQAILASSAGQAVRECRIMRAGDADALDLRVRATPMELQGETFTVFAASDISHEKRRRALERVFLHDIMNTVVGLKMLAGQFDRAGGPGAAALHRAIREGTERLLREAEGHRELLRAEAGELVARAGPFSSNEVIHEVLAIHPDDRCVVAPNSRGVRVVTDRTLLVRVLDNMVRNALEATGAGDTVTLWCEAARGEVRFRVHNPGCIPEDVAAQVFQRSFSTKGDGRGLGTYGMRLLTVRYLKGRVGFTSTEAEGTTFTVTLPT